MECPKLQLGNLWLEIDQEDGELLVAIYQGHTTNYAYLVEDKAKQLRDWLMANVYLMEKRNAPTGE